MHTVANRDDEVDVAGAAPGGGTSEAQASAARLQARIQEMRRLLDMLENAVSAQAGTCDRFQANVVLSRVRVELVQIQLLLAGLPGR